jgi:hypothetical protein
VHLPSRYPQVSAVVIRRMYPTAVIAGGQVISPP